MKAQDLFNVQRLATIVTGGANGIGYACAEVMVDNGANVTVIDRDPAALAKAVERLKHNGGTAFGEVADVTDKAALTRAFDSVAQRHGRIDVVTYSSLGRFAKGGSHVEQPR